MSILYLGVYIAWPSRWNIVGHLNLGMFIVSQFIPVVFLNQLRSLDTASVKDVTTILAQGSIAYLFGILLFRSYKKLPVNLHTWRRFLEPDDTWERAVQTRTTFFSLVGIGLLVLSMMGMGFVPLLSEDPISAKFMRGDYHDPYITWAVPYRLGIALLSIVIPLVLAIVIWRRRFGLLPVALVSLVLMVLTYQRSPALTGIVLIVVIWLVKKNHFNFALVAVSLAYIAGTLSSYLAARIFTPTAISSTAGSAQGVVEQIVATAPDVSDTITFYSQWVAWDRPLTLGRTYFGGLIPGNYEWNPGVWTLTLGNPSVDLSTILSGGMRLPLPLWGMVSFGTAGVFGLSFAAGVTVALLGRIPRILDISQIPGAKIVYVLLLYRQLNVTIGEFWTLSYTDLIQLFVMLWILRGLNSSKQYSKVYSPALAEVTGTIQGSKVF